MSRTLAFAALDKDFLLWSGLSTKVAVSASL